MLDGKILMYPTPFCFCMLIVASGIDYPLLCSYLSVAFILLLTIILNNILVYCYMYHLNIILLYYNST